MMKTSNIFNIDNTLSAEQETFEKIFTSENVLIERIISTGQITTEGEYYDQDQDEWVLLLQGYAIIVLDNSEKINLKTGDYIHIPAHQMHRVDFTSNLPACIWLAVHIKHNP